MRTITIIAIFIVVACEGIQAQSLKAEAVGGYEATIARRSPATLPGALNLDMSLAISGGAVVREEASSRIRTCTAKRTPGNQQPLLPHPGRCESVSRVEEIDRCLNGGKRDVGIRACTSLIESPKSNVRDIAKGYAYRGLKYLDMGNFEYAMADFEKSISVDP